MHFSESRGLVQGILVTSASYSCRCSYHSRFDTAITSQNALRSQRHLLKIERRDWVERSRSSTLVCEDPICKTSAGSERPILKYERQILLLLFYESRFLTTCQGALGLRWHCSKLNIAIRIKFGGKVSYFVIQSSYMQTGSSTGTNILGCGLMQNVNLLQAKVTRWRQFHQLY